MSKKEGFREIFCDKTGKDHLFVVANALATLELGTKFTFVAQTYFMNWNDVLNLAKNNLQPDKKVTKTKDEWRAMLTPEQFHVTREHGTERAWTGEYCERHEPGIYACVCCGTELFDSTTKFESGTGWPSFTEPVKDNVIQYHKDTSWGMTRVEVLCNVCDAHLGHVFPDGPAPSGLRFCINSASLKKVESEATA